MSLSRRTILKLAGAALLAGPALLKAQITNRKEITMKITKAGSQPSGKGPSDWFTGTVRIDPLFQAKEPARTSGASVTFEPGARTAWHTHPLGQTLIVTAGAGWTQAEGGNPGDPARRRREHSARFEALARGSAHDERDPYRHSGIARRQGRGMDGEGEQRGLSHQGMRGTILLIASAIALSLLVPAQTTARAGDAPTQAVATADANNSEPRKVQMNLKIGSRSFTATLDDNPSVQALQAMLPLKLKMAELNGNEKFARLPAALPTNASNPGKIQSGDLMLYGSDTLVLFYRSFPTSYRYSRLGRLDSPTGLAAAVGSGDIEIIYESK